MLKFLLSFRPGSFLAVAMLGLTSLIALAQPQSNQEPVDATEFKPAGAQGLVKGSAPDKPLRSVLPRPGNTYRSDSLGGEFELQWMRMTIRGNTFLFWGARAISLDQDSPLRTLITGMRMGPQERFGVGDVVTRLDGIALEEGMVKDGNGVWQIPEMERHFGTTDVRWIKQRRQEVNVGQIHIDNFDNSGNGGAPVTP